MSVYTERLTISVGPDNKSAYKAAAKAAGLSVSEWSRTVLDAASGLGGEVTARQRRLAEQQRRAHAASMRAKSVESGRSGRPPKEG